MTTPSGLFAGAGGFDVAVGGTTSLTGAALASEADAARNILTTGALITANLQNASSWSAKSSGFGVSLGTSGIPVPSMSPSQKGAGSDASTAYAAIANAQLTISNPALQKALTGQTPAEVIASLNRDAANTNRALAGLPDLAQVLRARRDLRPMRGGGARRHHRRGGGASQTYESPNWRWTPPPALCGQNDLFVCLTRDIILERRLRLDFVLERSIGTCGC